MSDKRNRFIRIWTIFSVIFVCLNLSLTISIDFNGAASGSIQVYYSNSSELNDIEAGYYCPWFPISEESTNVTFENVQLLTDTIRIDIDGTWDINIEKVNIKIFDLCLKRYSGSELYNSIEYKENLDIKLNEDGTIYIHRLDENANFTLNKHKYFSIYLMALLLFMVLIISCIINYLIERYFVVFKKIDPQHLMLISISVTMFVLMEAFNHHFWYIAIPYRLLNCTILISAYFLVYTLFFRKSFSIFACNFILTVFGLANYYLIIFRGKPLLPTDLVAIKTALNVAGGYNYPISILEILLILYSVCSWIFFKKSNEQNINVSKNKMLETIINLSVCFGLMFCALLSDTYKGMNISYYDSDILYFNKKYGQVLNFIKYQEATRVSKPDDYFETYDSNFIEKIPIVGGGTSETDTGIQPTNIIMIMDESFSDLAVFNKDFGEEITPFINSLKENTIKGNLYVSVRGGGTCNTEYETLTGNSLIFLPIGATPYETYIHNNVNSFVQFLKKLNYETYALHIEDSSNWNRSEVYPYLGFEHFLSNNDFDDIVTVRERATDEYNFNKIIELYENKTSDKLFIYNVTIQNHGGYNQAGDLEQTVNLSNYGNFYDAEIYLSLIKNSDYALKELVEYFKNIDEPSMIIFYGDHQPSLSSETEQWLFSAEDSKESTIERYVTPFLIWTNYDMPSENIDMMSANYLSSFIMKYANLSLPIYNQFLLYMYDKYPVLTTQGIIDKNNIFYENFKDIERSEFDFSIYERLQYQSMFEINYRKDIFE